MANSIDLWVKATFQIDVEAYPRLRKDDAAQAEPKLISHPDEQLEHLLEELAIDDPTTQGVKRAEEPVGFEFPIEPPPVFQHAIVNGKLHNGTGRTLTYLSAHAKRGHITEGPPDQIPPDEDGE